MSVVLLLRVAFIACVVALCILAWLPGDEMMLVRTPFGGHAEHTLAYLATTIVMGLALHRRVRLGMQCILLAGYAGILEVGQLYSPGRHASVVDWAFSTTGIVIGAVLLSVFPSVYQAWSDKGHAVRAAGRGAPDGLRDADPQRRRDR